MGCPVASAAVIARRRDSKPCVRASAGLETGRIQQIGGVGIIALHLSNFVREVHCVTNGLTSVLPANG